VPGTAPRALAQMADVGDAAGDEPVDVTVVLGLRDRDGLEALIAAQQDRRSPRYRRWADAAELADRFGARRAEYERVRAWFASKGFEVVRDFGHRNGFVARTTVAGAAAAFATPMRRFRANGHTYRAPAADVLLPESIAGAVRGILGLDDLPKFRPVAKVSSTQSALAPSDFAAAYDVAGLRDAGVTGSGRSIAVVARSNFDDRDIVTFAQRYLHPPTLSYSRTLVDQTRDPGILAAKGEVVEVLIDTQWAGALAPDAHVNVVISPRGGDIPDSLQKAVADHAGDVISVSFSLCEADAPTVATEYFDALYALANAQGQTVVVAAGDSGGAECAEGHGGPSVNALASSPHAVAVGGTQFALTTGGALQLPIVESVWRDSYGAGGGGESIRFARPLYQLAAGILTLDGGRALPDVALAASPQSPGYVIVESGATRIVGGTSAGTPALGSMLALVGERLAQTTGDGALGQLLPALYRAGSAQRRGGPTVFRDVVQGDNRLDGGAGDPATPGFDLASGWGAPLATALSATLAAPGPCEPATDCLVPGRGPRRKACTAEWLVERDPPGPPTTVQTCRDGDPGCDLDGAADGHCTIDVALCLNVLDTRPGMVTAGGAPACPARKVRDVRLVSPRSGSFDPTAASNRSALVGALADLPRLPSNLRTACSATVPVVVPATDGPVKPTRLRARVIDGAGGKSAVVQLRCTVS
jgi:subtilase family serine protease